LNNSGMVFVGILLRSKQSGNPKRFS